MTRQWLHVPSRARQGDVKYKYFVAETKQISRVKHVDCYCAPDSTVRSVDRSCSVHDCQSQSGKFCAYTYEPNDNEISFDDFDSVTKSAAERFCKSNMQCYSDAELNACIFDYCIDPDVATGDVEFMASTHFEHGCPDDAAPTDAPEAMEVTAPACTNPVSKWGQCGGRSHTGSTCCESGSMCKRQNEWYSQCQ